MNETLKKGGRVLVALLLLCAIAHGEDLTTRDGTVYKGYKVLGHDAGFLTIMYADGGAKIPLGQLPDDLQKKYGYDPAAAAAAVQAAAAQDREEKKVVEAQQLAQQQAARDAAARAAAARQAAAQQAAVPAVVPSSPTPPASAPGGGAAPPAPAASTTGDATPVPSSANGALTWPQIETLSLQITTAKIEKFHRELAAKRHGSDAGAGTAGATAAQDEQATAESDKMIARYNIQRSLLESHSMAGPVLSDGQIKEKRQELRSLRDQHSQQSGSEEEKIMAEQRMDLLELELEFANSTVQ